METTIQCNEAANVALLTPTAIETPEQKIERLKAEVAEMERVQYEAKREAERQEREVRQAAERIERNAKKFAWFKEAVVGFRAIAVEAGLNPELGTGIEYHEESNTYGEPIARIIDRR